MTIRNQRGSLVIPLIIAMVLFVGASLFGIWAYAGMQDYKSNLDKKVAVQVSSAVTEAEKKKDEAYAEKEKQPLRIYKGLDVYGSINIQYPKTWSAYIAETSNNTSLPIDGFFNPGYVPSTSSGVPLVLRLQVVGTQYKQTMQQYENLQKVNKAKITAYRLPKVQDNIALGSRVEGQVTPNQQGSMIVLPLRDKTIKIWTEGTQGLSDFNNIILPNMTFVP